jgi:hypothetical protein
MKWFALFIMLNFGCEKPQPTYPKKEDIVTKECIKKENGEIIVAPPPAYGNKVVMSE